MRAPKLSLLAVVVAAGLSLTACQGEDSTSASGSSDSSSAQSSGGSSAPADDNSTGAQSGSSSGGSDGGGASGSGSCKTSQLDFSTSHGMSEGITLINLKNTGSAACTLQGFPGADLKGKDGTVSATRSKIGPTKVGVAPGEETRFTLHHPMNDSGGSGVTYTSLIVTPPGETHSHTLPVSINVPVSDGPSSAITVDPVGAGK
ncbi:DUF4232 domain-containing protein [Streptomyces niger]|uniref:DUF4232 domain-containing protein n=1 Tax=Streptomyces niger TaxID=66373 RepID=UPI00069C367B|nr:DUF4232 domain-containing protein [Streptomyces niger]